MTDFRAPLDDIAFSLSHVAMADGLPDWDAELAAEIATHFASFAEGELAPINVTGDQQGAVLEGGRVRMPAGFVAAYESYAAQGWPGLTVPEAFGGQGLSPAIAGITSEIFAGANHSMQMVTGLVPGAVRVLQEFGTADQQAALIPPLADGGWLATMALTEAGAGSDLSRIRCRAVRDGDGWRIDGEKIFISGGDQDMSAGIFHLVLARTSDAPIKGLSLFACLSERGDGSRNAVSVTRIEEKLGLHASPTCQIAFDGAEAVLIGVEGAGLAGMFAMMNHARLDVSLQGVAHAARAVQIARAYAAERVQGKGQTLDSHADVIRMLDEADLRAVGARGIAHLALVALEGGENPDLVEALTPIAKVFCTDVSTEAADLAMQVLGGYGYLEEYGVAQVWRDARICRIYEGANGIHALSLATRLARLGAPLDAIDALCAKEPALAVILAAWRGARADLAAADAAQLAHGFMNLSAELLHQLVWLRIDRNAEEHPEPTRMRKLTRRAKARAGIVIAAYAAERELATGLVTPV